jgi:hypothetical protein
MAETVPSSRVGLGIIILSATLLPLIVLSV